jgi:hypothetical protein
VRTIEGIRRKPDSSANTIGAPSRVVFFYPRPDVPFPAFDFFPILLQRTPFGF